MDRSEPKSSFFEEQCQQQESEREEETSTNLMNDSLYSTSQLELSCNVHDIVETNRGLSGSGRPTFGSAVYHISADENSRSNVASRNEHMSINDDVNRSYFSGKRVTPDSCINTECDDADDEYMVNSPDTKKAKTMLCPAQVPKKIQDSHMIICSRRETIIEVEQNLGSKRTFVESLDELGNSSFPFFSSLSQAESNSCRELVGADASDLSGRGSCESNEDIDSILSSLPISLEYSSALGERGKIDDSTSVSSSPEEYLQILEASQKLDNMGNNFFEHGDYQNALASYSKALRVKRKTLKCALHLNARNKKDLTDKLLASVATSINNIGYLLQRSGVPMCEVMAAYKDSLQIKQKILGNGHLSVGRTLNNIGSVYFKNRDYHNALESYKQAQKIMIANLGQDHLDVATVYSNIGDVYMSSKKLNAALKNYKESLRIRWSQMGHGNSKVTRLLEKIATIEMADTSQKLNEQQIYNCNNNHSNSYNDCEDDLRELGEDIEDDLSDVQRMSRKLALDMIRDRIKMIRQMRKLEAGKDEMPLGMMNANNHNNNDSCSVTSSTGYESDSSMILHGRKDALTYLTENAARAKEEESSSTSYGIASHLPSTSSFISPPPVLVRAVSDECEERFDEAAEVLTEE